MEEFDKEALLSITQLLEEQYSKSSKFESNIVLKIESLTGMTLKGKIMEQLEKVGITEPYKIVNKFGGNIKTFATFICYNKPSLFLNYEIDCVKKLFILARTILKLNFTTTEIKPNLWIRTRKKKTVNKTFLQLSDEEEDRINYFCESGDYDMKIVQYFNELKKMVSDIAFKIIKDIDVTERSVKSKLESCSSNKQSLSLQKNENTQKEEDGSTIQTNKLIQHNINVINDKFVTERKYRINEHPQDPIDEYNNSLNLAVSSHSAKGDNNRRLSGFSKAISPNEPEFHPSLNEHVQGIPPINTDTHLLMKVATQQHATQNLLYTPVEPQLHWV